MSDGSEYNEIDELTAIVGEVKRVQVKGKVYSISACSMVDMPKLQRLLSEFEKIENKKNTSQLMADESSLKLMARIIHMGIKENHPDMNEDAILKAFSLGAFPIIIQIMMDLNDFLSGMGRLRSQGEVVEQMAGMQKGVFPQQLKTSKSLAKKN